MQCISIFFFAFFLLSRSAFSLPVTGKWSNIQTHSEGSLEKILEVHHLPPFTDNLPNGFPDVKEQVKIVREEGSSDQADAPLYILLDKREPFFLVPLLKRRIGKSVPLADLGAFLYFEDVLEDYLFYYPHCEGKRPRASGEHLKQVATIVSTKRRRDIFNKCFS